MAEILDETTALESNTVGVYRTAATVKGGRRFSFSSLVVVGNRAGQVGLGYGKANEVPKAIENAQKEAKRRMKSYPLQGTTIPHAVTGRFGACIVRLLPASPGTGVIAGAAVRAPLEMLGIQDCLTKAYGSSNGKNLVKAVIDGLDQLRSKQMVEELRGITLQATEVEEAIERGRAFMPAPKPVTTTTPQRDQKSSGKKKFGGGRKSGANQGRGGAVDRDRSEKKTQPKSATDQQVPESTADPTVKPTETKTDTETK